MSEDEADSKSGITYVPNAIPCVVCVKRKQDCIRIVKPTTPKGGRPIIKCRFCQKTKAKCIPSKTIASKAPQKKSAKRRTVSTELATPPAKKARSDIRDEDLISSTLGLASETLGQTKSLAALKQTCDGLEASINTFNNHLVALEAFDNRKTVALEGIHDIYAKHAKNATFIESLPPFIPSQGLKTSNPKASSLPNDAGTSSAPLPSAVYIGSKPKVASSTASTSSSPGKPAKA